MVEVDEQPVHLTGKEYGILELLSLRKGTTLTKEMFLNHLYGGMDEPELKIIDVFICKLRKKLTDATGGDHYIETVWGRGYVLRDPETEPARQHALKVLFIAGSYSQKPQRCELPTNRLAIKWLDYVIICARTKCFLDVGVFG